MSLPLPTLAIGSMSTTVTRQKVRDASTVCFPGDSLEEGVDDSIPAGDPTFSWSIPFRTYLTNLFVAAGKTPPTYSLTAAASYTTTDLVTNKVAKLPASRVFITIFPINDVFFAIPTATTQANVRTILRYMLQKTPDALICWGLPAFLLGEDWPIGANANDAAIGVMDAAVLSVLQEPEFAPRMVIVDVRAASFARAPTVNPGHLANSVQTQSLGTHGAKVGTRPPGVDAQTFWSGLFQTDVPTDTS